MSAPLNQILFFLNCFTVKTILKKMAGSTIFVVVQLNIIYGNPFDADAQRSPLS